MNTSAIYCICKSNIQHDIYRLIIVKCSNLIFFCNEYSPLQAINFQQVIFLEQFTVSAFPMLHCHSVVQSYSSSPECFHSHLAFSPTQISAKTIQLNNITTCFYVLIKQNYLNINYHEVKYYSPGTKIQVLVDQLNCLM